MGGIEFNKIFAAVLVAGIIAMFGGFVGKLLIHPQKPAEHAYNIEVVEMAAPGAPKPMAEPILAMIADADVARGERIARACIACHTFNKGGANGVGPNLYGTLGGPKDHAAGYAYSGVLKEQGGDVWAYVEMNKFLWKPKDYARGTKMAYAGLRKPEDRAALIAWLRTQADSAVALPSAAEIAAEEAELSPPPEPEENAAEEEVTPTEAENPAAE